MLGTGAMAVVKTFDVCAGLEQAANGVDVGARGTQGATILAWRWLFMLGEEAGRDARVQKLR